MDFFKSLLPPLKIPKLKKLKQWNGASILNLQQLKNLPSRTRNVGTVASVVVRPPEVPAATIQNGTAKCHSRKRSDISIISASVPTTSRDGAAGGLYALKCDRNAAKRGILLNLPRKMMGVMGGGGVGAGDGNLDGVSYQSEEMVHEKFSPCKKRVVEPPPRRKRMRKREEEGREFYCGDRLLERNRSELFRIAERGSNERLNERRRRGDEAAPPPPWLISGGRKTRSADNILALKSYGGSESDEDDAEQVRSLKVSRMAEWQGPASMPLKYSESMESDTEEVRGRVRRVKMKKASEYSIENDSEKIEVRFRKNHGSTESEEVRPAPPVPLPTRVVALRQQEPKVKVKPKLPEKPPPKKPVEQFVTAKDFAENFKPLAAVLQESIKSADLKRKWINDFLSESDEEPAKKQQSSESLTKKFAMVDRFDRQLEQLERGATFITKDSVESVNIFHNGGDFDEFDKLFQADSVKKSVKVNEQVTVINRKQNLHNFSSSSFDSDVVRPPIPPPLPPPIVSPRSTVNIQDYYDKKLQRVRSTNNNNNSASVFIVGETFKAPPPVKRYINYKFDDYGNIEVSGSSATSRPRRTFNINDFHDDCYNEEGVVII
ncbi:hypothetical protein quinque_014857 [Culex quinquefasciatus]